VLEVVVKGGHVTAIRVVRDSVGNSGLLRKVQDGLKRARMPGSGAETTLRVIIHL
jgi:hypothetical protein